MTLTELAKKLPTDSIKIEETEHGYRLSFDLSKVTVHHFNNETAGGIDIKKID